MVAHGIAQPDTVQNDSANDENFNANVVMDIMTGGAFDPNDPNNRAAYVDNLLNTGQVNNQHDLTVLYGMGSNGAVHDETIRNMSFDQDGGASSTMQAAARMFDNLNDRFTGNNESDMSVAHRTSTDDEVGANDANKEAVSEEDADTTIVDAGDAQHDDRWTADENLIVEIPKEATNDKELGDSIAYLVERLAIAGVSDVDITNAMKEGALHHDDAQMGAFVELGRLAEGKKIPGVDQYVNDVKIAMGIENQPVPNEQAPEITPIAQYTPEPPENNNELNNPVPQQPVGMRL